MGEGATSLRLDSDFEVPPALRAGERRVSRRRSVSKWPPGRSKSSLTIWPRDGRETRRAGSVTVGLREASNFLAPGEGQGAVRIEISLVYDQGGPAFESYRTWMYHNEAALETKSGRRIAPRPIISTRQQGDGSVAVEYNFADVQGTPGDYRFVYVAPTLITQLPVEFRFPKIPVARGRSRRDKTMNVREAIKLSYGTPDHICRGYLADLKDSDLLLRPVPGANHIAWQLGHLINVGVRNDRGDLPRLVPAASRRIRGKTRQEDGDQRRPEGLSTRRTST